MKTLNIKNRHRLNKKRSRELENALCMRYGNCIDLSKHTVERATSEEQELYLIDNKVGAFQLGEGAALTVRGLLLFRPERYWVTVDMGAVRFVTNGADVMAPGIVDADDDIATGDLVWVRDERNEQPLAIGEALCAGEEMVERESGRAIKSIHYVGDALWHAGED